MYPDEGAGNGSATLRIAMHAANALPGIVRSLQHCPEKECSLNSGTCNPVMTSYSSVTFQRKVFTLALNAGPHTALVSEVPKLCRMCQSASYLCVVCGMTSVPDCSRQQAGSGSQQKMGHQDMQAAQIQQ